MGIKHCDPFMINNFPVDIMTIFCHNIPKIFNADCNNENEINRDVKSDSY